MTSLEKSIKQIVEPIVNNLGYKIYDVIYEKDGKDNYLRIWAQHHSDQVRNYL